MRIVVALIKTMSDFKFKVWQCHPKSARIVEAEKTLNGTAHPDGVKFCRPYSSANSAGWWLFPPVDIDIRWKGAEDGFEYVEREPFLPVEHDLAKSLVRPSDETDVEMWCPRLVGRTKFSWGDVKPNVCQMWTGCIFQTNPGWVLHVRSPINFERNSNFSIMEGVIETDWMQYDIWLNIQFDNTDWVHLRKDQWPPLAQLVPMRRESYDANWSFETEMLNRDSPEANKVVESWFDYNTKKFCKGGYAIMSKHDPDRRKDASTFYKERMRHMGSKDAMEPDPGMICPHAMKSTVKKFKKKLLKRTDDLET